MMQDERKKELVSILLESPFYLTLTIEERHSLVAQLTEDYPGGMQVGDEETFLGDTIL